MQLHVPRAIATRPLFSRQNFYRLPPQLRCQAFRMASTLPRLPIFEAITSHDPKSTAIVHHPSGRSFTYGELVHDVADATEELRIKAGRRELFGERITFLVENGYDYVGEQPQTGSITLPQSANNRSDLTLHIRKPWHSCTSVHDSSKS